MRCGLHGKLPAKRDFVCLSVPRAFLRVWEPWLEQGLVESRRQMGLADWNEAFVAAPIWRFWLGEKVCGKTIIGAMMPSMDACRRLFPLTLVGVTDSKEVLAPPVIDPLWAWFERAEALLDSALDRGASLDSMRAALAGLVKGRAAEAPAGTDGEQMAPASHRSLQQMFSRLAETASGSLGSASFFWTIGGAGYEPLALCHEFLPAAADFSVLLRPRFVRQPEPSLELG